jgi:hypothetical protein
MPLEEARHDGDLAADLDVVAGLGKAEAATVLGVEEDAAG